MIDSSSGSVDGLVVDDLGGAPAVAEDGEGEGAEAADGVEPALEEDGFAGVGEQFGGAGARECASMVMCVVPLTGGRLRLGADGTVCGAPGVRLKYRCQCAHTRRSLSSLGLSSSSGIRDPFRDRMNSVLAGQNRLKPVGNEKPPSTMWTRALSPGVIGLRGATTVRSGPWGREPRCGSGRGSGAAAGHKPRRGNGRTRGLLLDRGADRSRAGSGVSLQRRGGRPHSVAYCVGGGRLSGRHGGAAACPLHCLCGGSVAWRGWRCQGWGASRADGSVCPAAQSQGASRSSAARGAR